MGARLYYLTRRRGLVHGCSVPRLRRGVDRGRVGGVVAVTVRWREVPDRDRDFTGCVLATVGALSFPIVLLLFRITEWVVL